MRGTIRTRRIVGRSVYDQMLERGLEFDLTDHEMFRKRVKLTVRLMFVAIAILVVLGASGCEVERRRSDGELGLNPQQAAGRKLYDNYCDRCHRPYSTKGKKGPGLKGIFQHQYLSLTGLPANDERVGEIIRGGRPDMPGYGQVLNSQDLQDLLAYLHTL